MSSISSFCSSFFDNTIHNDAPEDKPEDKAEDNKQEEAEPEAAEEEEEEPEDPLPAVREECEKTAACSPAVKHYHHCQEKVNAGEGFKGEDCVEELMMHCVDNCAAPRLFHKLK